MRAAAAVVHVLAALHPHPPLDCFFHLCVVYGTGAWCAPLLLLCVCLKSLNPIPASFFLLWHVRVEVNLFVFCVRDRDLARTAADVVRVLVAPHPHP